MEAADPAPQDTARHRDGDDDREQKARRGEFVAERYEVGDEIGCEHRLTPLKAKQAKDRPRSSGAFRTEAMVLRKSASRKRRDGTRSSSNLARNGCSIAANTMQAAAVANTAPRHPRTPAIAGARKPQISKPAGTAVCLIENTNGARRGGETR